jgi:tRNA (cmo5U34)-methyltransferase
MKNKKPFNFNNIENFDDHIDKSIPTYCNLIESIRSIVSYFYVENSTIYDLGCSTGKFLESLDFKRAKKIGIDNSELLPKKYGYFNTDLNKTLEIKNASIVLSIFTMQFIDPKQRQRFLNDIYNGLDSGGVLILTEKIYQEHGKIQEILAFSHYDYKVKHFTPEEIMQKERDLRLIMKPNRESEIYEKLENAGFEYVSSFWQMYNFKGFIAIKK